MGASGLKLPKRNCSGRRRKKISSAAKLADTSRDLIVPAPQHRLRGSCLAVDAVLTTVCFVLQAATSLRASQACFDLVVTWQGGLPFESASHTTIQNWILRIGLYELQRPKEFADDWIWIVDHTIQIGTIKVLLILGIRRSKWIQLDRPLVHTDLEVLELLPVEVSNGEVVRKQYAAVAQRNGVPQAILSDQGSDLQRGLKLLQNKHHDVIGLGDVTHKVALLLKTLLESDDAWDDVQDALRDDQGNDPTNAARSSGTAEVQDQSPIHERVGADSLGAIGLLVAPAASRWHFVGAATSGVACGVARRETWLGGIVRRFVGRLVGTDRLGPTSVQSGAALGIREWWGRTSRRSFTGSGDGKWSSIPLATDRVRAQRVCQAAIGMLVARQQRSDRIADWQRQAIGGSTKSKRLHALRAGAGGIGGDPDSIAS